MKDKDDVKFLPASNGEGLYVERNKEDDSVSFSFWRKSGKKVELSSEQCKELLLTLTPSLREPSYKNNDSLVAALKQEFDTQGTII